MTKDFQLSLPDVVSILDWAIVELSSGLDFWPFKNCEKTFKMIFIHGENERMVIF